MKWAIRDDSQFPLNWLLFVSPLHMPHKSPSCFGLLVKVMSLRRQSFESFFREFISYAPMLYFSSRPFVPLSSTPVEKCFQFIYFLRLSRWSSFSRKTKESVHDKGLEGYENWQLANNRKTILYIQQDFNRNVCCSPRVKSFLLLFLPAANDNRIEPFSILSLPAFQSPSVSSWEVI